ncbi:glycosyltransferase family 22 protein [Tilletiaria anomala UBC 951]|uniref:Mannosyltransferase n=1 Tax=Tilletiaria anomala (strain ATCC 24038 / CBS 436.72 / UBC 951) TaxID=1037660 RepID=A0A066VB91_TILAU|nr:glycosyltransferase family 22 protein [Tilletiaria anomala UBC 951]KDN39012.1 glycosyltransferase family 22 protein [Tilletiaria anomala UBC 951]
MVVVYDSPGTRKQSGPSKRAPPSTTRDTSSPLLQDGSERKWYLSSWAPSRQAAFSLLLIARLISASASIIPDCDETYNYWEPLHQLLYPPAPASNQLGSFKTWEYDPRFAIRSWAYLIQFTPLKWYTNLTGMSKYQHFYFTRATLACVSAAVEARFYDAVKETAGARTARYLLVSLLGCASIFEASTALVPSSYTFYTTTLAWSFAMKPSNGDPASRSLRCLKATVAFALGAIVGWPFAIVLALPFVFEELVSFQRTITDSFMQRACRFSQAAIATGLCIGLPTLLIDTLAYGRTTLIPWNIIAYNIFSKARGAGPELYGTEGQTYYFRVLLLSFNLLLPLALSSAPLVLLAGVVNPHAFAQTAPAAHRVSKQPVVLLLNRTTPFYLWLLLLSLQPHKEERFLYPAYALVCFNAALSLSLLHTLIDSALPRALLTGACFPQRKAGITIGGALAWTAVLLSSFIGVLRSAALTHNYSAPLHIVSPLWGPEARQILQERHIALAENATPKEVMAALSKLQGPVKLCYAGEWYRFPTSFLVPHGIQSEFTSSTYQHILPGHFPVTYDRGEEKGRDLFAAAVLKAGDWAWTYKGSRISEQNYNEFNLPEPSHVINPTQCDYMVDLDFKHRRAGAGSSIDAYESAAEPSYLHQPARWRRIHCLPFLDWESSQAEPGASLVRKIEAAVSRALWLPEGWGSTRKYADFCLLKRIGEGSGNLHRDTDMKRAEDHFDAAD